ncbi:hypothetical protein PV755_00610 [Streptomyces caniscabiei]|uniref:hypothetical protein n=1 Tax=Streptomyces caniscabiei TaxID=2746961 RepID=UPI0029B511C2|nr:hypothetical protein [Streptomyces caniscabiei]MDX3507435.1 hypothetical protein [Streptomyces caniscabiei]
MSYDIFEIVPEPPVPVRRIVRVRAALPDGWGTGSYAPRTALEAARLLQAEGKRVCLVSDSDHTCLTDDRPSLVDLP